MYVSTLPGELTYVRLIWAEMMGRARSRYEAGMRERRACYSFTMKKPHPRYDPITPIVPEHLDAQIRWHKAWLDYGQRVGEEFLFTAAVTPHNHPRRI